MFKENCILSALLLVSLSPTATAWQSQQQPLTTGIRRHGNDRFSFAGYPTTTALSLANANSLMPDGTSPESAGSSKVEQFSKLKTLETRLKKLQEEQVGKEENYQQRIQTVMGEMDKKEKDLLRKVKDFASQLEQYRFDSQQSLLTAKWASEKKEAGLREEIRTLRLKVEELEGEYSKAKEFTETLIAQRNDLEKELKVMRERYATDITDWENRYELEQNERKKEQTKNKELLVEAQEVAKKREKEAVTSGKEMAGKMKEMYASHLAETEKQLIDMTEQVEGKDEYIGELESERSSVRKMVSHSVGLISTRVKKGVTKVLKPTKSTTATQNNNNNKASASAAPATFTAVDVSSLSNSDDAFEFDAIMGETTLVGNSTGKS